MSLLTDSLTKYLPGAELVRAIALTEQKRLHLYVRGSQGKEAGPLEQFLSEQSGLQVQLCDVTHWVEADFLRETLQLLGHSQDFSADDDKYLFEESIEASLEEDIQVEFTRWGRGPLKGTLSHTLPIEEVLDEPQSEEASAAFHAEMEPPLPESPLEKEPEPPETEMDIQERIRREMEEMLAQEAPAPRKRKKRAPSRFFGEVAMRTASIADALEQGPQKGLILQGELIRLESRLTRNERIRYSGTLYDGSGSVPFGFFASPKEEAFLNEALKKDSYYRVKGDLSYSDYDRCMVVQASKLQEVPAPPLPGDDAPVKRTELSMLSNMSEVDGICDVQTILERAVHYGMSAIAVTDHMNLLSFPKLASLSEKLPIKVIYGMEGMLYDDETLPFDLPDTAAFDGTFVALDFETTGLRPDRDEIIEIGAVRVHNHEVVDTFSALARPSSPLSEFTTNLTGITQAMVDAAPPLADSLGPLMDFIGDAPLAAHNAAFDFAFLREALKGQGRELPNPIVDTLALSHLAFPELRTHNLKRIAKELKIKQGQHHRALDDALVCGKILSLLLQTFTSQGIETFSSLNALADDVFYRSFSRRYKFTLLAAKQEAFPLLYELLSDANLHHLTHRGPAIPRSRLKSLGDAFLLGSGDRAGELFEGIFSGEPREKLLERASLYDFLELQPPVQLHPLVEKEHLASNDEIIEMQEVVFSLADELSLPVAATTHARYLDEGDYLYRNIVREGQKRGYAQESRPSLTFLRTQEMLRAFAHFAEEKAKEIVIDNPNAIAQKIPALMPLKKGKYPPTIDRSDEILREICFDKAYSIYGKPLPVSVEERIESELAGIIGNGYAVLYIAAQKLVKRSKEMGYAVGSRGSVGSSLAATLAEITEVNPLPAHYACASCNILEYNEDTRYENGYDMPSKNCPKCGVKMYQDGFNIPFESFMGFDGNKEPDIDLNFSPAIQLQIQQYTGDLFGKDLVFKGGTVSAVKDRTAYGYTKSYFEARGRELSEAEASRIASRLEGIRRSTGQHPAGIITIPRGVSIYEFTPLQYPAHNASSGVITTHFDYDALKGRLMKLDILGHDVPTLFHDIEELSGIRHEDISLQDKEVLRLFNGVEILGLSDTRWPLGKGTLGVPEFGTSFTRGILEEVRMEGIEDLVRVSGLSHGRNVWSGNAQDLVREGTVDFKSVIATREQIMIYGQEMGLTRAMAFELMNKVKSGTRLTEEEIKAMEEAGIPKWYIESCNKMGYMFPKAHAVAYVLNGYRVAWYKLHAPAAFYAAYFSTKVDTFDTSRMCRGIDAAYEELTSGQSEGRGKDKESDTLSLMEVVYEMYARGLEFAPPRLYTSHAQKFLLEEGKILPPLRAIPGVGENAALSIAAEREKGDFLSVEDLTSRAKLNKVATEALRSCGALEGLSETNQLDLFSFL